jgi:hypothetical protein
LYAQEQFILTFHSPRKLPVLLVLRALVGCWPCAGVPPQPTVCAAIIIPTPTSGCDWPPILVCCTAGEGEAVAGPGADEGEGNTYRQIGAEMRVQSSYFSPQFPQKYPMAFTLHHRAGIFQYFLS